jgi:hypothetical protein
LNAIFSAKVGLRKANSGKDGSGLKGSTSRRFNLCRVHEALRQSAGAWDR